MRRADRRTLMLATGLSAAAFAAAALVPSPSARLSAAAQDPAPVTTGVREASWSPDSRRIAATWFDAIWTMSIDGKAVGTMPSTAVPNTTCATPPVVMTITDPEKLGLLGAAPTCNAFRMVSDNRTYLTWAKAEVQLRSGVVNSVVIHATTAN